MCEVTAKKRSKAMEVIRRGPAREVFSNNCRELLTYGEVVDILCTRYNKSEKKHRLLNEL